MEAKRRWQDQHWMWRGFQSAVFLYAQCGPCLAWRESQRQKKQWKWEKKERAKYRDEPGVLRQPQPHEVNPHWEEEIQLGPAPPRKGKKRPGTKDTMSPSTVSASNQTNRGVNALIGDSKERPMFWNSKRFQRPDEEIVYVDPTEERHNMVYRPPDIIRRGSSVGVGAWIVDKNPTPEQPKRVYTPTSSMPPVNELHPPVVSSMPAKREDREWMTAPPPSAAFMHGKKGVTTRSRSGSGNSSLQTTDEQLSRQVGHRILEEKLKTGLLPQDNMDIRPSSRQRVENSEGDVARIQRSNSTSPFRLVREKTPPSPMRARERRPAPLRLNSNKSSKTVSTRKNSNSNTETTSSSEASSKEQRRARTTYQSVTKTKTHSNPALNSNPVSPPGEVEVRPISQSTASTKQSPTSTLQQAKDSATATPITASPPVVDNYEASPRKQKDRKIDDAPLLVKDSSLHILQDVVDPQTLLNSKWVKSPVIEARVPLPPGDSPQKENKSPVKRTRPSAKEQLMLEEGARRWSWTA